MIELSPSDFVLSLLAFFMMILGIGALLTGVVRPRTPARPLVLFGVFSLLYGIRVAASLPVVDMIPGLSLERLNAIRFDLTYVLLLPLMLLVEQFVSRGWYGTMHATVSLQLAYSTVGIVADRVRGVPGSLMIIKPYIVLAIGTAALANILWAARRTHDFPRALSVGFVSFLATVGLFNLAEIVHKPISARIETAGYIGLVACLAYAVAGRTLDTEARLTSIEREIQTAQRIQASILPQDLPDVPGLTLRVRYVPMATMAGDFYDFVPIDRERCGILIADASGHGVAASLIASMVKVALDAERSHTGDPSALLSGMNAALVGLLGRGRDYVTASYLVVDLAARQVRYADAGHPPPLLLSATGSVSALDAGGPILGQFAQARYESGVRDVDMCSRILMFTDGVTEATSPRGEHFGIERLAAFMTGHADAGADQCATSLLNEITAWTGGARAHDDVTIVVVDLKGPPSRDVL